MVVGWRPVEDLVRWELAAAPDNALTGDPVNEDRA